MVTTLIFAKRSLILNSVQQIVRGPVKPFVQQRRSPLNHP